MVFSGNKMFTAVFIIMVLLVSVVCSVSASRYYVDSDANGLGDGSSWQNAFIELKDAIDVAQVEDVNEIWVAAGSYRPGDDGTSAFELFDGLELYGGFAGSESYLSERDIRANETFLLCDPNAANEPIVSINGCGPQTLLSGFTLTSGKYGINMLNNAQAAIEQCIIENNTSYGIGTSGGSAPTIENCIIRDNDGKGVYFYQPGQFKMINSWIYNNGYASGDPEGIHIYDGDVESVIRNCTIAYNDGDGIYVQSSSAEPLVKNCIIWGNNNAGLQLDDQDCNVTYSCVQGGAAGTGNISTDPNFAYVNDIWGVFSFRLMPDSPCVNTGDTSAVETGETDIDLQARIVDSEVDMGADEFSCEPVWVQGDLDGDGIVATEDIQIFMYSWMTENGSFGYNPWCDFDGNDFIDLMDFRYMTKSWQDEACWYNVKICAQGDFDCSGVVNLIDFKTLANAWQTEPGMENWDPDCDLDGSQTIGIGDLKTFAGNWIQ